MSRGTRRAVESVAVGGALAERRVLALAAKLGGRPTVAEAGALRPDDGRERRGAGPAGIAGRGRAAGRTGRREGLRDLGPADAAGQGRRDRRHVGVTFCILLAQRESGMLITTPHLQDSSP